MENSNLSTKALIVVMKISQWTGRKFDKRGNKAVEQSHGTTGHVGNFNKMLLPNAKEIGEVERKASALRAFIYANTLPWYNDGARIISSKSYMEFTKEFSARKSDFEAAVSLFLQNYDVLRVNAQNSLGNLFNASDYPSRTELAAKFSCDVAFFPVPTVNDFRVEVCDEEKERFVKAIQETETAAKLDCFRRIQEVVTSATDKLKKPDAIYRDSLFDNIKELCAILPRLNVTDDTRLEQVRVEIESAINATSADQCRADKQKREATANKLDSIMSNMSAFMGGV